jgi:phosphonate transport system permease protein
MTSMANPGVDRELVIQRLAGERERTPFLRWSLAVLAALIVYSWLTGGFQMQDFFSERRLFNVQRFATELKPFPLQQKPWDWSVAAQWMGELMTVKGWRAVATTLAISIAAIALAGLGGAMLTLPAARTFAAPEAYGPHARPPTFAVRMVWSALVGLTRLLLIFLRAIPEYVWTFILVTVLGPNAWAAVLALAVHNAGILGKLNAEVVENLPGETLSALRAVGAGRRQVALAGILPAIAPRLLLFFLYRWETCVREATVLGMLGIVSLGFFVQDARARQHYDEMFALILLGSAIVLIGDLFSALARSVVRKSS